MTEKTIDLVKRKKISLCKNCKYHVTIADACLTRNQLKICFEFEEYGTKERFHLVEFFTFATEKYHRFISDIYCGDDGDVISVNLSDFQYFHADCTGEAVKDEKLDWKKIEFSKTPLSDMWLRKHNNV